MMRVELFRPVQDDIRRLLRNVGLRVGVVFTGRFATRILELTIDNPEITAPLMMPMHQENLRSNSERSASVFRRS